MASCHASGIFLFRSVSEMWHEDAEYLLDGVPEFDSLAGRKAISFMRGTSHRVDGFDSHHRQNSIGAGSSEKSGRLCWSGGGRCKLFSYHKQGKVITKLIRRNLTMKMWEVHALLNGEGVRVSVWAPTKGRAMVEALSAYPDLVIDRVDRLPQY